MAKLRISFDVDTSECFDRLAAVGDQGSLLGARVIGAFLTGKVSMSDHIGLRYYGVEFVSAEPAPIVRERD